MCGRYDTVVIGGGFYGCTLALAYARAGQQVALFERESDLMQRASYVNQARVHNGYHYPRSYLTALRSAANFRRFTSEFGACIDDRFTHVYAIARSNSKVSTSQFRRFCSLISAPLTRVPQQIRGLMNMDLIEDAFCVTEYAFDANGLREVLRASLDRCNVRVSCATSVERVSPYEDGRVLVHLENGTCVNAGRVFNCAYSSINDLLRRSELPLLPLKYELAEVALVAVPEQLASVAFTVMDGPFFSTMPFPARKLHSLTHVRYTPHRAWSDASAANDGREPQATSSRYLHMVKDAQRYVPALRHSRYVDSLFEVKSLLIQHEVDDGRPILFRNHYGIENFCIIMGSKLDNIYDALSTLRGVGLLEEVKNGAGA